MWLSCHVPIQYIDQLFCSMKIEAITDDDDDGLDAAAAADDDDDDGDGDDDCDDVDDDYKLIIAYIHTSL